MIRIRKGETLWWTTCRACPEYEEPDHSHIQAILSAAWHGHRRHDALRPTNLGRAVFPKLSRFMGSG